MNGQNYYYFIANDEDDANQKAYTYMRMFWRDLSFVNVKKIHNKLWQVFNDS